jgi:hypothetical protein
MSVDVTGMMVNLSNENNENERGRSETPSTVGQASVTQSWSKKIKQLDDNCLFGEYRNKFNRKAKNNLRLMTIYFSLLFVKKGYTKAARCKSAKSIIEKFNWKQLQVKKLNRYLQNVRRSFKFVCEVTVAEFGLVSRGLNAIGHEVTEMMDDEEKLAKITKRYEDMGGVYKMIQLAVNEERSNITKKMMVQVQGE